MTGVGGASAATRVGLNFMHLIAAVVIVGPLMSSAVSVEQREVASPTAE
jgi:hypothetical protein